ncbi:MAG TPA: hypothetical protein VF246_09395 [Acidimicrobiia bacterium]
MADGVRLLFRGALVIFILTVVIGILNGLDVWEVPRDILLTHVHSGTLGWITLGVFGAAGAMLAKPGESVRSMAVFGVVAMTAYIVAFGSVHWTGTSMQRPIGGTLALISIVWFFVWAIRSKKGVPYTVADFGIVLALGFLLFGAVLGVLLGLQLGGVEIVPQERTDALYSSHPGAMVIGYVILAGASLIEWLIQGRPPRISESRSGMIQMLLLFLAGLISVIGFLADVEALIQAAVPLQVVATVMLLVRHRSRLGASSWGPGLGPKLVRTAIVGLIAVVVLIAALVVQLSGGADIEELEPVLLAMDHTNFVLVMTSLIFAVLLIESDVRERLITISYGLMVVGAVGFVAGLLTQSVTLKQIFTPILGLGLLHGIISFLRARAREAVPSGAP